MIRSLFFYACLLSSTCALPVAAQQVPIEQRMSSSEFKAAGLYRLTPEELAQLNLWLGKSKANAAAQPRDEIQPSRARRSADLNKTRIKGSIPSWDVGTVFELENGERWEVVAGKVHLYRALQNPEVTLVPSLMGAWFLKFNAEPDVAKPKVERVR